MRPKPDQLQRERAVDLHPIILNKEFEVIGHIPKLMATWLTRFLKRHINCGKVVIKGKRVNRGGGFGLEVPCEYNFEGDNFSCVRLHRKLGAILVYEMFSSQCKTAVVNFIRTAHCYSQGTMTKVKTVSWYGCVVTDTVTIV